MFYPVESLKRGGRFYLCWVADSWPGRFAAINRRQLWSQDIRKICDDLLEVIQQETGRPSNRFSLRLSSQLIRGLARLYQRKVDVLAVDLCMIDAHVMKSTRPPQEPHEDRGSREHILPRLVFEEPDEERVIELIQDNANIVARVEDITLKEPTITDNRPLDDGFGELQPYPQAVMSDRTIETMLGLDASQAGGPAHSALDMHVQLDVSGRSHERSRRATHDAALMEGISEYDISAFTKSGGEIRTVGDFEKQIPEISEIPPPELSVPQAMQTDGDNNLQVVPITEKSVELDQRRINLCLEEIELEEMEQEQLAKKRKRDKLKIDKKIILSSNYLRSRIENINLELHEDIITDRMRVPSYLLLRRAGVAGHRVRPSFGLTLTRMYLRNLGPGSKHTGREIEIEEPLAREQTARTSALKRVHEVSEAVHKVPEIVIEPPQLAPENISALDPNISVRGPNVSVRDPNISDRDPNISHQMQVQEQIDISNWPTQNIHELPLVETQDEVCPPKKSRHGGHMSFKEFTLKVDLQANKENVPISVQQIESLLHQAGLADGQDGQTRPSQTQADTQTETAQRNASERHSETPLGSLDRTRVSLGDSVDTTESQRFIREEWGTQGTMTKVYECLRRRVRPLSLARLLASARAPRGRARLVAAKCFYSLLKLIQNQFIIVTKNPVTFAIDDIRLGPRLRKT